ncbi:MAG: hypothetical protein QOF16_1788, partial [Actinomycetota bacterium]|nr:hypothetical protein [Actinomycetota bacterium]
MRILDLLFRLLGTATFDSLQLVPSRDFSSS